MYIFNPIFRTKKIFFSFCIATLFLMKIKHIYCTITAMHATLIMIWICGVKYVKLS